MFKKSQVHLLRVILLFALVVISVSPVSAQDGVQASSPDCPKFDPSLVHDQEFLQSLPPECQKLYKAPVVRSTADLDMSGILPLAAGGPDNFGYTWSDGVAYSWLDVTSGTDTGMTDYGWGQATGAISLPFPFKYYENTYSQVYIAASGYLSFSETYNWAGQQDIPNGAEPNNVIAPYWFPSYIGSGGWVRYKSGGSAPNRYFVVEWHNLTDDSDLDDLYQFEAILHENGDIVFQYHTMMPNGDSYPCGESGIEDSFGLDGLSYTEFCQMSPDSKAVRFYRPAPEARVGMEPLYQGELVQAGKTESFLISIRNTGELGTDTFDLVASSTWSAAFFEANGFTLLTDTDADTVIDTGPIAIGASKDIIVKFSVPIYAQVGDDIAVTVTATSTLDTSKAKTASISMAIPKGFVSVYDDETNGAMSFMTANPVWTDTQSVTGNNYYGYDVAVELLTTQNYLYAWDKFYSNASGWVSNIEYAIVGSSGEIVRSVTNLTNNTVGTVSVRDYMPSITVTPDGTVGIVWYRYQYNSSTFENNYNIYFATLDSAGNLLTGPTNVTNNPVWGDGTWISDPQISGTTDNRFVLAWSKYSPDDVRDIYYSVRNSAGGVFLGVTNLTNDTPGSTTGYLQPALASLTSGRVMLTWAGRLNGDGDIHYAVLASNGSVFKSDTVLPGDGTGNDWNNGDVVQLPNGKLLIAWEAWGCYPPEWAARLRYILLDSSYNAIGLPQCISKAPGAYEEQAVSVTIGDEESGVLTWMDENNQYLYYALVDVGGSGAILTEPTIFHRSASYVESSWNGQGSAPLPVTPTIVKTALKSIALQDGWIVESTETSGVGGLLNDTGNILVAGDNAKDKQYLSIISFNTSGIPDNAVITDVKLRIRVQGFMGDNLFDPVKTHGNLLVDMGGPRIGTNVNLMLEDFEATVKLAAAGVLLSAPVKGNYNITLDAESYQYVDVTGKTQVRLRFELDDNDDLSADYINIFSGDSTDERRPKLIIEYYVP